MGIIHRGASKQLLQPLVGEGLTGFVSASSTLSNPSPQKTTLNRMWLAWPVCYDLRESPLPPVREGERKLGVFRDNTEPPPNSPFSTQPLPSPNKKCFMRRRKGAPLKLVFLAHFLMPSYLA